MKRIVSLIVALLFLFYLIFSIYYLKNEKSVEVCNGLEICITDSLKNNFISARKIRSILENQKLDPTGKAIKQINTDDLESFLYKNRLIRNVEAYLTPSGIIKLDIQQKVPIFRILNPDANYYIDEEGTVMPTSSSYTVIVPIVTGSVSLDFAQNELYQFFLYIRKDSFWNNQIEQVVVDRNGELTLIPRVGNHRIILGTLDDLEEKLEKMDLFYKQIVPKMGWEKYKEINLKYKNQLVCTKR